MLRLEELEPRLSPSLLLPDPQVPAQALLAVIRPYQPPCVQCETAPQGIYQIPRNKE